MKLQDFILLGDNLSDLLSNFSHSMIQIDLLKSMTHFSSISNQLNSINMSEKLCLQWNDFQDNIKIAFGNLTMILLM